MGDGGPVREVVDGGVHNYCLADDEGWEDVEINLVDSAVDDHVAGDAEEDQEIYTSVKKIVGEQALGETAE